MGQGTITLPSGDKLITQTETLAGGALVHREEIVISGTLSNQFALPTPTQPAATDYGLPVWINAMPTQVVDAAIHAMNAVLSNSIAIGGAVDDVSTVAVGEGKVGAARITSLRAQHVSLRNEAGGELGTAGTPLHVSTNGVTQPVSFSGTISMADSARYSEQVTQTSKLTTIDTDILAITTAVLGTPAVKFASAQSVTISGVPAVSVPGTPTVSVFGTPSVAISTIPPVAFASPQPISTVAGTVRIDPTGTTTQPISWAGAPTVSLPGTPAVTVFGTPSVNVASHPPVTFASAQPISTLSGTVSVTFPSTQNVAVPGTLSLPDYARYSEQTTQTTRLVTIDTDVLGITAAILGTPAVKFASAQSVSISNTPNVVVPGTPAVSIFGTPSVALSTVPPITFASSQPISTVAGTVRIDPTGTTTQPISWAGAPNVTVPGTPAVTVFGTPSVNVASLPAVTFASPQPVSTVAGTVSVTFPSAQSISVTNTPAVTFASAQPISNVAGTVRIDPTGTTTQPVSIAANVNIGAVQGTVNVSFTPSATQAISSVAGTVRIDPTGTTTQPVSFASAQPISTVAGTVAVNVRNNIFSMKSAKIDMGSSGNNAVVGSIFGKRLKVYAMSFNADRSGTVSMVWMDGATPMSGTQTFLNREGAVEAVSPPAYLFAPSPGTSIQIHIPAGNTAGLRGRLSFWDDDTN